MAMSYVLARSLMYSKRWVEGKVRYYDSQSLASDTPSSPLTCLLSLAIPCKKYSGNTTISAP
jgi:hypothetical protein